MPISGLFSALHSIHLRSHTMGCARAVCGAALAALTALSLLASPVRYKGSFGGGGGRKMHLRAPRAKGMERPPLAATTAPLRRRAAAPMRTAHRTQLPLACCRSASLPAADSSVCTNIFSALVSPRSLPLQALALSWQRSGGLPAGAGVDNTIANVNRELFPAVSFTADGGVGLLTLQAPTRSQYRSLDGGRQAGPAPCCLEASTLVHTRSAAACACMQPGQPAERPPPTHEACILCRSWSKVSDNAFIAVYALSSTRFLAVGQSGPNYDRNAPNQLFT